jgi:hypothetical protein
MRKLLLASAVLALSACSGGNNDANNAAGADNMGMDQNITADQNSTLDSVNAAAANGSIDANTQAAMQKDVKTHDQDTNLANGM